MVLSTGHLSIITKQSFHTVLSKPQMPLFATPTQDLFKYATKIETYRNTNFQCYVAFILNNMGFDENRSGSINRVICALKSGKMSSDSISKTSGLGRVLQEFEYREGLFKQIAQHGKGVSEIVLRDVIQPVSFQVMKEAGEQALNLLKQKSIEPISIPEVAENKTGFLQNIANGVSQAVNHVSSVLNYLNTKILNFPGASAAETDLLPNSFTDEQARKIEDLIKKSAKIIASQIQKAKGKQAILLLGPTGAGKGTFGNYMHSDYCTSNPAKITCNKEIFATAAGPDSHTSYLEVFEVEEKLKKWLGPDTVLVDMPGYFDKRTDRLESLIYALFTSKSIHEIRKQPHVNVYLIDYRSFLSARAHLIAEVKDLIEDKEEEACVVLITKVPRKVAFEVDDTPVSIVPSKEDIRKELRKEGYSDTALKHLILYDVVDRDLASDCSLDDSNMYKCSGGGGSNREQIMDELRKVFSLTTSLATHTCAIDSKHKNELALLQKELLNALEIGFSSASFNFEKFNRKYKRFEILLKIDHPALDEIKNGINKQIDSKKDLLFSEIKKLKNYLLYQIDLRESIDVEILEKIDNLNSFKDIHHCPDISSDVNDLVTAILNDCSTKIFSILNTPSLWNEDKTQIQTRLLFKLVHGLDKQYESEFFKDKIKPQLNKQLRMIEAEYYKNLHICAFAEVREMALTFKNLQSFLAEVIPDYSYIRKSLTPYAELEKSYNELVMWKRIKVAAKLSGTVAILIGASYVSVPAVTLIKGLEGVNGMVCLGDAISVIFKTQTGFTVTVEDLMATALIQAGGELLYSKVSNELCQKAWKQTNFAMNVPAVFKLS